MCRLSRLYIYRAEGTPKLFIIHYSLLIRKAPPCAPVAFIYTKISLLYKFVLLVSVKQGSLYRGTLLFITNMIYLIKCRIWRFQEC